jgi:hypothetical protein
MGTALSKSDDTTRFTDNLRVRCPPSLPVAIDKAASRHLTTSSEYIRRSVIDRLVADGIDPAQAALGSEG